MYIVLYRNMLLQVQELQEAGWEDCGDHRSQHWHWQDHRRWHVQAGRQGDHALQGHGQGGACSCRHQVSDSTERWMSECLLYYQAGDQGWCECWEDGPCQPGQHLSLCGQAEEICHQNRYLDQQCWCHDVPPDKDWGWIWDANRNKPLWPLLLDQLASAPC